MTVQEGGESKKQEYEERIHRSKRSRNSGQNKGKNPFRESAQKQEKSQYPCGFPASYA